MTRTTNPALLRELHGEWSARGCAICGDHPVELHHLQKRSQGGADSNGNIVGLCGAFSKNRHHEAVEAHRVEVYRTQNGGLAWRNRQTSEAGVCVLPVGWVEVVEDGAAPGGAAPARTAPPLPLSGERFASTTHSPQERFAYLQALTRTAAQHMLRIATALLEAKESGEWQALGFESWRDYYGEAGLGLPSGTVSKMLKVAEFYRAEWARTVLAGVSVERLYLAARSAGDPEEALDLAVSTPSYVLAGRSKDARREQEERGVCGECGRPL